ncbi:MAG: AI-2E family transporter [Bacteroidota bacterium]|nr:AI-2E family transporter [Bacteroidota bacterium]MDP4191186.1 AI-2E family transporter [Bacteroidota bacterium]MDP4194010.1 AI-2E family transporter [Bacteroidota bacterium]
MSELIIKKPVKTLLIALLIALVLYISFLFSEIIIMLAVSVLLSLIFNPFVTLLETWGLGRTLSIFIIIIITLVLLTLGLSFLIPRLSEQMDTLSESIRHANLKQTITDFDRKIVRFIPFLRPGAVYTRFEGLISSMLTDLLNSLTVFVSSLVSLIAVLVIVPFITFFLLKDNKRIIKGIVNVMPNKYFEMSYVVIRQISIQLGRFVRGWIFDAFMVGLLSGTGLSILGINNAIPIGIIAGVGHLIPYFGPIIGGVPAIIISVAQFGDFSMLPKIIIMFLGIYALDNGIIQPNVFSKSVDMHPIIIIILIIAGSQIMGIMGMLLAVPTATVVRTAAKEIYNAYRNFTIIKT